MSVPSCVPVAGLKTPMTFPARWVATVKCSSLPVGFGFYLPLGHWGYDRSIIRISREAYYITIQLSDQPHAEGKLFKTFKILIMQIILINYKFPICIKFR